MCPAVVDSNGPIVPGAVVAALVDFVDIIASFVVDFPPTVVKVATVSAVVLGSRVAADSSVVVIVCAALLVDSDGCVLVTVGDVGLSVVDDSVSRVDPICPTIVDSVGPADSICPVGTDVVGLTDIAEVVSGVWADVVVPPDVKENVSGAEVDVSVEAGVGGSTDVLETVSRAEVDCSADVDSVG